jgi:hypothetical protein
MPARRFRKRPVEVEAVRFTGVNAQEVAEFTGQDGRTVPGDGWMIRTLEGEMRAEVGDWIIRGVKGEFYPCKPDIFEATYEPAEAEMPPGL